MPGAQKRACPENEFRKLLMPVQPEQLLAAACRMAESFDLGAGGV